MSYYSNHVQPNIVEEMVDLGSVIPRWKVKSILERIKGVARNHDGSARTMQSCSDLAVSEASRAEYLARAEENRWAANDLRLLVEDVEAKL
jgi:hypothetical protein